MARKRVGKRTSRQENEQTGEQVDRRMSWQENELARERVGKRTSRQEKE